MYIMHNLNYTVIGLGVQDRKELHLGLKKKLTNFCKTLSKPQGRSAAGKDWLNWEKTKLHHRESNTCSEDYS
jgi:hypothetical protein